jgi:hypothetical protein
MEIWTMVFPYHLMVLNFSSREKAYEYLLKDIPRNLCSIHSNQAITSLNKSYNLNKDFFCATYKDFDDEIEDEYAYVFKNTFNPEEIITASEYPRLVEKRL